MSVTVRCPDCKVAQLNTPRISVRLDKARSEALPFKICRRCKLMIPTKKNEFAKWRVWNGSEYHQLDG